MPPKLVCFFSPALSNLDILWVRISSISGCTVSYMLSHCNISEINRDVSYNLIACHNLIGSLFSFLVVHKIMGHLTTHGIFDEMK